MSYILRTLFFIALCLPPALCKSQVANFTVDHTSGCVPLIVHFTNTSTGATSYSWDFGNTTGSALPNPSGSSYLTAGTYTVTLTAFNGPSSSTHSVVINVYPLPVANFSTTDTARCPGVPIAFTNTSSAGMPGSMTYSWNFGDGGTSTLSAPAHPYVSPGFYTVTLYATNAGGCINSFSRSSYIHIFTKPVANFSAPAPSACNAPAPVSFSNSSTGTAPLTYKWTFGDGNTSTLSAPTNSYASIGSFPVKLRVTNINGCMDSLTRPSYVNIGSLIPGFGSSGSVCVENSITFTNTSGPHISSFWKFGDGGTSSDENPTYTYYTPGTYTAKLIVSNGSCFDSVTHVITVYPKPIIGFSYTPAQPCAPPVTQTFTATMPAGSTAAWNFGDGGSATGNPATHPFTSAQITPVSLAVTDIHGCTNTTQKIDTLNALILNISATATQGCIPLAVTLSTNRFSTVFDRIHGALASYAYPFTTTSYTWNFGDGSPPSSSPTPSHTYTAIGTFVVTCTITTANGCTKTSSFVIKAGTPPLSSFFATPPSHVCTHKLVTFTSTSSASANNFTWNFADGESDGGPSPTTSHIYSSPGTYSVTLNAQFNGCPSAAAYVVPVIVDSPGVLPGYHYLCTPANGVQFNDFSAGATSRLWIFGDGDTTSAANPAHFYPSLTYFTARLATYNATSGCRDTSVAISVDLAPVNFTFLGMDTTLCLGQPDTFVAHPGMGGPIADYRWAIDGAVAGIPYDSLFYSFSTPGYHTVRLAITDTRGCHDTLIKTNYVHVANPLAHFVPTPISGCAPLTVTFTDGSTDDPGISVSSYFWKFSNVDSTLVTAHTVTHTYTASGVYFVLERITDSFGCVDTTIGSPVSVYHPTASFSGISTVCAGSPAHFFNNSSDTTSAFWTFGDGTTSTAISPAHVYSAAGTYAVRLVAQDGHGCTDTLTSLSFITVHPRPIAAFTMSDTFAVCPPLNVTFTNISTGASSYYWTFGDGASSVLSDPSNPYTVPGFYPVTLVATNSFGCTDTATSSSTIFGYTGAFSYTPTSGCSPLPVHFNVTLGSVSSVVWDFSDGYISSASLSDTISHTYTVPGSYIPKLILTDTTGCTSYSLGSDTIKVDRIIPFISILPNPACKNSTVLFTDSSYSYFSGSTSWTWSFGGGITSTTSSTSHAYTATGIYTVSLTATNGSGCTGSVVKSVTVNALPATITGGLSLCTGYTTSLSCAPGSGTWSSSSTTVATISATGVVTGIAAGTAGITYTLPSGCQATTVVTVHMLPSTIAGPTNLCNGSTATLSSSSAGGTWSSGTPAVVSIASTGVITSVTSGSTVITYTDGMGCFTTQGITVNALPAPITGSLDICIGAVVSLSDLTPSGTWGSSNIAIATINPTSGVVTGISNGTATITYTLPTGCTTTAVTTVNVAPPPIAGLLTVCGGYSNMLTNSMPGGTWSSSAPAIASIHPTTGVVTGITPGTVTISYSVLSGCVSTAVVTMNPLPAPITGPHQVCIGSIITLNETTPGGTWESSNISVATISSTGIVSGVSAGSIIITYRIPTGCINTYAVTVNAAPLPIAGADSVCEEGTVIFTSATPGGEWTSANPAIADIDLATGVLTGILNGTTLISYNLPATGCYTTKPVTVNATPAIIGTASVCIGSSATLTSTLPGGTWTSSNPAMAAVGATTGIVTGLVAGGTVTITYTLPATGCYATKPVTVNAIPTSIVGAANVCIGSSTTLLSTLPGGTWASSNPAIATIGATTGLVTGLAAGGIFTITYTLTTGACEATHNMTVNALPPVHGVTGGGSYCATGSGVHIGLDGSDTGVNYTLYYGTSATVSLTGTGAPLDFGLQSGAGLYTVHATNPTTGCERDMTGSSAVTITPVVIPSVTVGGPTGDTVCAGAATTFLPTPVNGGTAPVFEWRVNGTPVWTGSSYSFAPATGDVITVKMTSNAPCAVPDTATGSRTIFSRPSGMPTVTIAVDPNDTVCEFTTVTFTAGSTFAGTGGYTWFIDGVLSGTGTTFSYMPDNNDVVRCRVTSDYVCRLADTALSNAITITALPAQEPHVTINATPGLLLAAEAIDTLTAVITNAGPHPSYQWYLNGAIVPAATTNTYISQFKDNDSVSCRVTSSGLCPDVPGSAWVIIKIKQADSPASNIGLYPNPNNGTFTIKGNLADPTAQSVDLEVVNMLGQRLLWGKINASKGRINEVIQMPDSAASGMYLLKLIAGHQMETFHVVIKR